MFYFDFQNHTKRKIITSCMLVSAINNIFLVRCVTNNNLIKHLKSITSFIKCLILVQKKITTDINLISILH